ncbi:MAG: hypothetical protein OHK93_006556 [Ramalina farinacea]|uniref:Uncharacterized protein n=1 Tax=Ramalina farinacea TaxID=258253 RepID=A0AA43QIU0_9LECA|nr:hypothetical protein [Ramalina farinacea]
MAQIANLLPSDLMHSGHAESALDDSARLEPHSPLKFSRLGYQESIEKARRAKAINNISLQEEKRHRSRAEAARRASIRKQQLEDQRVREEEASLTGREYGAKLLESLEVQTKARLEAEFREEIRIRVYNDEQLLSAYQEMRKDEITMQLEEELEPIIKSKLELAQMKEVLDILREELRPGVVQSLKEELEESTREDVRNDLRLQLKGNVLKQLRLENEEHVLADLRRELRDEALQERELMRHTTTSGESLNASPPISSSPALAGASLHATEDHHKLDSNTIPDHGARSSVESIESIKEVVPMLEPEDGTDRGQTLITGPLSGNYGVGEGVGLSGQLNGTELPAKDLSSTGYHAAQTAGKDFTFDPILHEIRFSDPVDPPASARKRSSSASEHSNAEAGHPAKRARTGSVVSDNITAFQDAQSHAHLNHSTTYEVESGSKRNNYRVSEDMDITESGKILPLGDQAPKDPDITVSEALNVGKLERAGGKQANEDEEENEEEFGVNNEEEGEGEGEDDEQEQLEDEGEEDDEDVEEGEFDYTEAEKEDEESEPRTQVYGEGDRRETMERQSLTGEDEDEDQEEEWNEDEEITVTNGSFANAEVNGDVLDYTPTSSQQGLEYDTDTQTDDFESSSEAYDEYDAQQHGPPTMRFGDSLIKHGNTQETAIDLSDSDDEGKNETLVEDVNSRASIRADKTS